MILLSMIMDVIREVSEWTDMSDSAFSAIDTQAENRRPIRLSSGGRAHCFRRCKLGMSSICLLVHSTVDGGTWCMRLVLRYFHSTIRRINKYSTMIDQSLERVWCQIETNEAPRYTRSLFRKI